MYVYTNESDKIWKLVLGGGGEWRGVWISYCMVFNLRISHQTPFILIIHIITFQFNVSILPNGPTHF